MPNHVIAGEVLAAGLRSDFINTYRPMYKDSVAKLSKFVQLGVPSDKLIEPFAYFESAPHPKRWDRGTEISAKGFKAISFNVTNYDWGRKIAWHKNDRNDDQLKDLPNQARSLGQNFAFLHERIAFQILNGATDNDLLPAIPNAPDGVALFSTTDGAGSARFGATSGNLLSGSGVATSAALRTDLFTAIEQFQLFQDTEGQPLFDSGILERGLSIIYGVANTQIFSEAFIQSRTVQATASGQASTGAAVTNVVLESGVTFQLWATPRITTNDWYVVANGSVVKPIFQLEREGLKDYIETMDNSDNSRRTKEESIQWDARYGYGINIPYGIIKVDN